MIRALAKETAEVIEKLAEAYKAHQPVNPPNDMRTGIEVAIDAALRQVREALEPYLQHKEGCGLNSCQQCLARREAMIHTAPVSYLKPYRHKFIERPCTCGLALLRRSAAPVTKEET